MQNLSLATCRTALRVTGVTLTITVCGCATSGNLPAASGATLDPIAFFSGRSQGEGELDKLLGRSVRVSVASVGRTQGGTLVVDQTIREGGKPPRLRRWTIRPVGPNRYSGSLTDATGPVQVTVSGPRAYIRYEMNNGLQVEQQLALQASGTTLLNRLHVKKFGITIATLEEMIRKLD